MSPPYITSTIDDLTSLEYLSTIFKGIKKINFFPLETSGYSGSEFTRIQIEHDSNCGTTLIRKKTDLDKDWFSLRTRDFQGREYSLLTSNLFSLVNSNISLPYIGFSREKHSTGLLMWDLAKEILPDERAPLKEWQENLILDRMASLHAGFWEHNGLTTLKWLHTSRDLLYIMGPFDLDTKGLSARNIQLVIKEGWEHASKILPQNVVKFFKLPLDQVSNAFQQLPTTLVHGDTKVANFAISESRTLRAFDWAFCGTAPCTFDLCWYISVNASRLTSTKEHIIAKYRSYLTQHLRYNLDDQLWEKLLKAGIISACYMLLWSKARSLKLNKAGASQEWEWWVNNLTNSIKYYEL